MFTKEDNILLTKLIVPGEYDGLIRRHRLVDKINQGIGSKLIYISAPSGFGKSTLLVEWIGQTNRKTAWVSLERSENDPVEFFSYLIAAVRSENPEFGRNFLEVLAAQGEQAIDVVCRGFLNEAAGLEESITVILDDFHRIDNPDVISRFNFIINNQPEPINFIMASRTELPFAKSRLKLSGDLVEISADDLRFNFEEASGLLRNHIGNGLTDENILAVEEKTEGWAAGLQMAGLSMKTVDDIPAYISELSGVDRLIADYFLDEVLSQQTEEVRYFLLATSILNRISAPLCDYLLNSASSQQIIDQIETNQLFLIPLDRNGVWYRYHHLFTDLLFSRLNIQHPEMIEFLNLRASEWYEEQENFSEVIMHAVRGGEYERVGRIIIENSSPTWAHGKMTTLHHWISLMPDDCKYNNPEICLIKAWLVFHGNDFRQMFQLFNNAERSIALLEDDAEKSRLLGIKEAVLAGYYSHTNEFEKLVESSENALRLLPEEEFEWRFSTKVSLGIGYSNTNNIEKAEVVFKEVIDACAHREFLLAKTASIGNIGHLLIVKGEPERAFQLCRTELNTISDERVPPLNYLSGYLFAPMIEALYELNRLDEAREYLALFTDQINMGARSFHEFITGTTEVKLHISLNDFKAARYSANRLHQMNLAMDFSFRKFWVDVLKILINVRSGEQLENLAWMNAVEVWKFDKADYRRELEYLTYLELLIELGSADEVESYSTWLLNELKETPYKGTYLKVLILRVTILISNSKYQEAVTKLDEVLAAVRQNGAIRYLLDHKEIFKRSLKDLKKSGLEYWAVLENLVLNQAEKQQLNIEAQLTPREIEVLELMSRGNTNKKIAAELYISIDTVKNHAKRIYNKLNAKNRTEAVLIGRKSGLITE